MEAAVIRLGYLSLNMRIRMEFVEPGVHDRFPGGAWFGHCDVFRWTPTIAREYQAAARVLCRVYGPLHIFIQSDNNKLKRFAALGGFKHFFDERRGADAWEVWRRS